MNDIVEREIISCILQKSEKLMPIAVAEIKPGDFQTSAFRHIYKVMYDLFLDGKHIDVVSLSMHLGKDYAKTLVDTQFAAITTANFNNHLQSLTELSKKAKAKAIISELYELVYGDNMEMCQEKTALLLQTLGKRQNIIQANAAEGLDDFLKRINEPINYYETGFSLLDKYAMIEKGDFIIVGGRPSGGKTALTLQMASYMAKTRKVVYFSCETSKEKIYNRIIAHT